MRMKLEAPYLWITLAILLTVLSLNGCATRSAGEQQGQADMSNMNRFEQAAALAE